MHNITAVSTGIIMFGIFIWEKKINDVALFATQRVVTTMLWAELN